MIEALDILLVEDDAVFAGVLSRSLQRRGHRVAVAPDAAAARCLVAARVFSHAILDLKLAEGSGLSLIQPLLHAQPHLQVLVLTGYASIQTAVQAMKLGAMNYLCKPADTDSVLRALTQPNAESSGEPAAPLSLQPLSVDRLEWEHIQRVLAEHDQNISATARALGMHRRTLQRKLAKRPVQR